MKPTASLLFLLFSTLLNAGKAPNFIIIYADDLGYTQTSVPMMKDRPELGHSLHQTPHLEKLATRGMRFSNAYCPSPVCTSSRASIQFGMTTARVGCVSIHDVVMNKRKVDFEKNLSLAEMLKAQGYKTGIFGKWHLGHHREFLPNNHGFDEFMGIPYSNDMWPVDYDGNQVAADHPLAKRYPQLPFFKNFEIVKEIL